MHANANLTRRQLLAASCALPLLRLNATEDWGPLWQASLPHKERHPFLYYGKSDRARMKSRILREPWKTWWNGMGNPQVRANAAVRWWLSGDEAAANASRTDLLNAPIYRERTHGYLEPSSHHLSDYVAAYDVLAAWRGLRREDHRAIRDKIAAEVKFYFEVLSGPPVGGAHFGNQRTLGASAMAMAALALCEYKGDPGPAQWLQLAMHEIRREENWNFFRPGGQFIEGTGYANYMDTQFLPFAIAYERATGKYLFDDQVLRAQLIFCCYQLLANGDLVPWGTCEAGHGFAVAGLVSNARYGKDMAPLYAHAFRKTMHPNPLHNHLEIALYDEEVPGAMPPASRVFPPSHFAVFRESWENASVGAWFAGKEAGWQSAKLDLYRTYSHGDCGSFLISMDGEVLAADSGYDHWRSRDYFPAAFHNVLLIDGQGPDSHTTGEMSDFEAEGPVRHATVTCTYQECTVRRKLTLVGGRYVIVADRIDAAAPHDYAWQVRSSCGPQAEGTRLEGREVTWPALASDGWREHKLGRTQLTTVAPPFAELSLSPSRWRPISTPPEFINQVALAKWRAAKTEALFVLIPNRRENPDITWKSVSKTAEERPSSETSPVVGSGDPQRLIVEGPGWSDTISLHRGELRIVSSEGKVAFHGQV